MPIAKAAQTELTPDPLEP